MGLTDRWTMAADERANSSHVAAAPARSKPGGAAALLAPLATIAGVGPRHSALLARLLGLRTPPRRFDLLCHLPQAVIDRALRDGLDGAAEGERVTLEVKVQQHWPPLAPKRPYKVCCWTGTVFLHLVFFRARPAYLLDVLPIGEARVVSGVLSRFGAEWQIVHPELIASRAEIAGTGGLQPVYGLTEGLSQRQAQRLVQAALDGLPELSEWQEPARCEARGWPGFIEALRIVHNPLAPVDIAPTSPARQRLAFDELLANQLALRLLRASEIGGAGRRLEGDGRLREAVLRALPFRPTAGQERVLAEIDADLADGRRMLRLLQGDVGSGKTLIALLVMLRAVEAGAQAALMAPTELLARQHAATLARLLEPAGLVPVLLTGAERGSPRREVLAALASGRAPIAIGTHALFQEGVAFADLGLVVIDEQHRFGVQQRMELLAKGAACDLLVMTATPIPRTLVLSLYGDMAVSELREKPPGRQEVRTRALPLSRLEEVLAAAARALARDERLYWVCPLIGAGEEGDIAAAIDRFGTLRGRFGGRVGLVHGRMGAREKERAMAAFAGGETGILVATTVIEVGVDVPEASVMVIEQAERFGLAQLHQLRGRVGRGARPSTCLLLYGEPLGPAARARLATMRRTDDGFRIAEADLRLRGPGEVLGTRQSGLPAFRLADLAVHADLLPDAHAEARRALERDPRLSSPRGRALRDLLRLFERRAAARFLRSG
jgi:ATP-dependent DNA helicase RecG